MGVGVGWHGEFVLGLGLGTQPEELESDGTESNPENKSK
jgi:hypothetical protein